MPDHCLAGRREPNLDGYIFKGALFFIYTGSSKLRIRWYFYLTFEPQGQYRHPIPDPKVHDLLRHFANLQRRKYEQYSLAGIL